MDIKVLNRMEPWQWPKGTGQTILAVLSNRSAPAADRLVAAEMAGDCVVMNDELADALLAIVADDGESDELRGLAAISFGPALESADMFEFDDPEDVPVSEAKFHEMQACLRDLAMDDNTPKVVRRRALEASVRAPEEWHRDCVLQAYASDDRDWRLTAVFCMRFVAGLNEQIIEAVESDDDAIFCEAIQAAGNWEIEEAWPRIEKLLTSSDAEEYLLFAAIDAATSIRPDEAGVLLAPLLHSDDEDIVEAVHDALSMAALAQDDDELGW